MTYNLSEYLEPFWKAKRISEESVMFVGKNDTAPLIFTPDKIEKVMSSDRKTEYKEGLDFALENGRLKLLPNTKIPSLPLEEYFRDTPAKWERPDGIFDIEIKVDRKRLREKLELDGERFFAFGKKPFFYNNQIVVTYTHSDKWLGYIPESRPEIFKSFLDKAKNGKTPTLLFFGDSITTGADSSGGGLYTCEPCIDSFAVMIHKLLTEKFGEINYVNTAVGGKNTAWAYENLEENVIKHNPDMLVLAFGMNDGDRSPDDYYGLYKKMLTRVTEKFPNTPVLLVGTMIPNPESDWLKNQRYHVNSLYRLEGEFKNTAVCDMTRLSTELYMGGKRFRDLTGNGVNHPNDFLARIYAQAILTVLLGDY
ncbi:MAG: SGNH/GDSL hydrolase family protein [Ruminococcaceae bacterium]|nr:SGNH/GDSL hydrolase family protein [Oscillospiraceae bacterium]